METTIMGILGNLELSGLMQLEEGAKMSKVQNETCSFT